MTGPTQLLKALDDMEATAENLSVQQEVVEPRIRKQLEALRKGIRAVRTQVEAWETAHENDDRFAAMLDAFSKQTAIQNDLLKNVETALTGRTGSPFRAKEEILKEGEWLRGTLAGPPSDDVDPQLLKDAPSSQISSGLVLLGQALSGAASSTRAAKGTKT